MGKQAAAVVASRPIERIAEAADATNSWPIFVDAGGSSSPDLKPATPRPFSLAPRDLRPVLIGRGENPASG